MAITFPDARSLTRAFDSDENGVVNSKDKWPGNKQALQIYKDGQNISESGIQNDELTASIFAKKATLNENIIHLFEEPISQNPYEKPLSPQKPSGINLNQTGSGLRKAGKQGFWGGLLLTIGINFFLGDHKVGKIGEGIAIGSAVVGGVMWLVGKSLEKGTDQNAY